MSDENDETVGMELTDPMSRTLRYAEVTKGDAERRVAEAQATLDRLKTYVQLLRLVRKGALYKVLAEKQRGFFVRSYVRRLDAPALAFQFEEFHCAAFSSSPDAVMQLPEHLRGTADDIMRVHCPARGCGGDGACVVGVLSTHSRGYRFADSVTFFAVCPRCVTATVRDRGAPVEAGESAGPRTI